LNQQFEQLENRPLILTIHGIHINRSKFPDILPRLTRRNQLF
jgi:hypothetical protein